ncbi:uncharacterized protein CXorf51A-like [Mirounga leonina]|uniref:uncharacterized protein CXorf51A-like n=1 Tax=Mirounga leonina TaxID=9715 RepID=UPI00156C506D|nr:uncharacterized protein CXorf51A-like [Mirounga leonina]KAF3812854.1 hypothetical protein GH733_019508 [Mirounga leonina]
MSKVTRKLPQPNQDMERPTSSSEERKKMKTPNQPRSRGGDKVLKTTLKVKKTHHRSLSKKVSEKTTNPVRKPKKARRPPLFGHYHRLNETLRQDEPEQAQEKVEKSITSNDDQGGQ